MVFNTVEHRLMIESVRDELVARDQSLGRLTFFMEGRVQKTHLCSFQSPEVCPILFNICLPPLLRLIFSSGLKLHSCADTQLYLHIASVPGQIDHLPGSLEEV